MRLFIAIPVPEPVQEHFLFLQKQLPSDAKITKVKAFHLTLKFLGEVDESKLAVIKQQLATVSFDAFTAKLAGTGIFPDEKMIRVVWVGLEPADIIKNLQKAIDESLKDFFELDTRFHPHITLGRVKHVEDKQAFRESVQKLQVEPLEFPVTSFELIKSTLTKEGPVYEVLETCSSKPL